MPGPVPRRRAERDAPAADEYAPRSRTRTTEPEEPAPAARRSRRSEPAEEPEEEVRPRRGRGELPATRRTRTPEPEPEPAPSRRSRRAAAEEPEPEPASTRRRRSAPEPEPEPDEVPTVDELDELGDKEYEELLERFGIAEGLTQEDEFEAISAAVEAHHTPPPASRRRGAAAADEPAGRGSRRSQPEPAGRGSRRRSSGEDDPPEEKSGFKASRGFEAYGKIRKQLSSFEDDLKLSTTEVLGKFLEAEPFAVYGEHGLYDELKDGQRVWNCIRQFTNCPICNTGHNPRVVCLYNLVEFPEDGDPKLTVVKAGPKLEKVIAAKGKLKAAGGDLSVHYWSLSQSESGPKDGPPDYFCELVFTRDLESVWGIPPLTDDELDEFEAKMKDETYVKFPTERQLRDVAAKLVD